MELNPWKELDTLSQEHSDNDHDHQEQPLTEFDPLASPEEQAAREAWRTSEGHLPQHPHNKTPAPAPAPAEDGPQSSALPFLSSILPSSLSVSPPSRSSSPFPSLASIAKTFSLPNLTRARQAQVTPQNTVVSNVVPQEAIETSETNGQVSTSPTQQETDVEVQFDFQKFLDQMKSRSAEPVSKYLRSFLNNFTKRPIIVSDQVRIIGDFLNFIAVQMRNCEVWKNALDAEFDNALEGMEKLVMNRLYDFTFAPQAAQAVPPKLYNPDDIERDHVLAQRISLFGWIEESHLDIPLDEGSQGFVMFAEQELLKINHYKAPRDKLICILNCCKVIFGLIRHLNKEEGADSFIPILIFVVLKANPPHLMSNVEFINRFRNPTKLQGEVGYYLSSLIGAISFIETMDHTSLSNITKEEFENKVEAAIQALPDLNPQSPIISRQGVPGTITAEVEKQTPSPHAGEESAQPLALSTPALVNSLGEDARRLLMKTGDTISKPLTAIGRIFSEALDEAENKLAYLPAPFAPFELGRERREGGDGQSSPQQYPHPQTPSTSASAPPPLIQTPYKARVRKIPPTHMLSSYSPSPETMAGLSLEDTPSRTTTPWQAYTPPQSAGSYQQIHSPAPRGYPTYPHMYQQMQSASQLSPRNQSKLQGQVADNASLEFSGSTGTSPGTVSPLPYIPHTQTSSAIDTSGVDVNAAKNTLSQIFSSTDMEVIDLVLETNGGDIGKSIEALLELSSGQ